MVFITDMTNKDLSKEARKYSWKCKLDEQRSQLKVHALKVRQWTIWSFGQEFRDILGGSTTVVLGGDFKQAPPVMAEGTREEIVNAGIKRSYFWKNIHIIMKLTRNMRLRNMGSDDELRHSFFDWVISIGNGSSDVEIYETWASILEELLFMEAIPTKCCSPQNFTFSWLSWNTSTRAKIEDRNTSNASTNCGSKCWTLQWNKPNNNSTCPMVTRLEAQIMTG